MEIERFSALSEHTIYIVLKEIEDEKHLESDDIPANITPKAYWVTRKHVVEKGLVNGVKVQEVMIGKVYWIGTPLLTKSGQKFLDSYNGRLKCGQQV